MKGHPSCRIYGEYLTPENASDLAEEGVEYELTKSGIPNQYPDKGPQYNGNHDYWKERLDSQISLFRQINAS